MSASEEKIVKELGEINPLNSLLFEAVEHGRVQEIAPLVERGAQVDVKMKWSLNGGVERVQVTPLMVAASYHQIEAIKELIKNGANIRAATDDDSTTVLMLAATVDSPDLVRILVRAGADMEAVQYNVVTGWRGECTPLIFSVHSGNRRALAEFLRLGASVSFKPGHTSSLSVAMAHKHSDIALDLLAAGARLAQEESSNNTEILSMAAQNNLIHVLRRQVRQGNALDKQSSVETALALAISHNLVDIAAFLLTEDAHELAVAHLREAISSDHAEMVLYLLARSPLLFNEITFLDMIQRHPVPPYDLAQGPFYNAMKIFLAYSPQFTQGFIGQFNNQPIDEKRLLVFKALVESGLLGPDVLAPLIRALSGQDSVPQWGLTAEILSGFNQGRSLVGKHFQFFQDKILAVVLAKFTQDLVVQTMLQNPKFIQDLAEKARLSEEEAKQAMAESLKEILEFRLYLPMFEFKHHRAVRAGNLLELVKILMHHFSFGTDLEYVLKLFEGTNDHGETMLDLAARLPENHIIRTLFMDMVRSLLLVQAPRLKQIQNVIETSASNTNLLPTDCVVLVAARDIQENVCYFARQPGGKSLLQQIIKGLLGNPIENSDPLLKAQIVLSKVLEQVFVAAKKQQTIAGAAQMQKASAAAAQAEAQVEQAPEDKMNAEQRRIVAEQQKFIADVGMAMTEEDRKAASAFISFVNAQADTRIPSWLERWANTKNEILEWESVMPRNDEISDTLNWCAAGYPLILKDGVSRIYSFLVKIRENNHHLQNAQIIELCDDSLLILKHAKTVSAAAELKLMQDSWVSRGKSSATNAQKQKLAAPVERAQAPEARVKGRGSDRSDVPRPFQNVPAQLENAVNKIKAAAQSNKLSENLALIFSAELQNALTRLSNRPQQQPQAQQRPPQQQAPNGEQSQEAVQEPQHPLAGAARYSNRN